MSRTTPTPDSPDSIEVAALRYSTADPEAARLEARIAELESEHRLETRRIAQMITRAKKKLFAPNMMQKG